MQSTNFEYGSPYLVVCHVIFKKHFNILILFSKVVLLNIFVETIIIFQYRDRFSLFTSCLILVCLLLTYWLFISTYKAIFCMTSIKLPST